MSDQDDTPDARSGVSPRPAAFAFAVVFALLALALIIQIGDQTKWANGKPWVAQPRFWPGVGLAMMLGFGGLHAVMQYRNRAAGLGREIWFWLRAVEYAGWLIGYVWLVPIIGYLPASLLVAPVLAWRLGFRTAGGVLAALGLALTIVVVFRVILRVNIPGGEAYRLLPDTLSSFMLTYF